MTAATELRCNILIKVYSTVGKLAEGSLLLELCAPMSAQSPVSIRATGATAHLSKVDLSVRYSVVQITTTLTGT